MASVHSLHRILGSFLSVVFVACGSAPDGDDGPVGESATDASSGGGQHHSGGQGSGWESGGAAATSGGAPPSSGAGGSAPSLGGSGGGTSLGGSGGGASLGGSGAGLAGASLGGSTALGGAQSAGGATSAEGGTVSSGGVQAAGGSSATGGRWPWNNGGSAEGGGAGFAGETGMAGAGGATAGAAGEGHAGTAGDGSSGDECPGAGNVTYVLNGAESWPSDVTERLSAAMEEAVWYYNCYSNLSHALTVNYRESVPTAEANVDGWMSFGSNRAYQVLATVMHEIGHTMGVGYYPWTELTDADRHWTGAAVLELMASLPEDEKDPGEPDFITADAMHFWPYGLNYASEHVSDWSLINHVRIVAAMNADKQAYLAGR